MARFAHCAEPTPRRTYFFLKRGRAYLQRRIDFRTGREEVWFHEGPGRGWAPCFEYREPAEAAANITYAHLGVEVVEEQL